MVCYLLGGDIICPGGDIILSRRILRIPLARGITQTTGCGKNAPNYTYVHILSLFLDTPTKEGVFSFCRVIETESQNAGVVHTQLAPYR